MKQLSPLEHVGFSKAESRIYTSLIAKGGGTISDLMVETGFYRPTIYKYIGVLIKKGFVRVGTRGKRKIYYAESPQKIEALIDLWYSTLSKNVDDLKDSFDYQGKKPIVRYEEGKEAIINAYSDVVRSLKRGEMYFRYSSDRALRSKQKLYSPKDYGTIRDAKGLERLIITNEPTKKAHSNKLGREIKTVPRDFDLFEYDVSQIIFGNKMVIIDYNTETVITVENPVIAEFQKKIFKLLFKKL
jgi:sugar-specific transcriptional regulator TrmB